MPGSQMPDSSKGFRSLLIDSKSTRASTACRGVIAARRPISSGVPPNPARSRRWVARSPFQSAAAMGERSLAHSAGAPEETVRVATAIVNEDAASTMHQERERIGRRRRVVGMVLLWNLPDSVDYTPWALRAVA